MKILNEYQQKVKILFTGRGEVVMENMMEHMSDHFQLSKCVSSNMDFLLALNRFHPKVVIICLLGETRETLRIFEPLFEDAKYEGLPVIAIGKKEDCDCFRSAMHMKYMEIFERPLDRERFLECLEEFSVLSKDWKEEEVEMIGMEYEDEDFFGNQEVEEQLLRKVEQLTLLKGRKTILVVDDDVRMLNLIKLHLQDLYDIAAVPSGKLALKFLSKKTADLVLLDYMMPEMDGTEVLRQIRHNSPKTDIPVIFLTGISDKDMVMRGLELRPNGYILKPATREVLLERVTEALLGL